MEHFKKDDWIRYAMDLVDEETKETMEEHLLNCDSCLELYTDIISGNLEIDTLHPTPDFSKKVMKNIRIDANLQNRRKFLYYVAVASLTLMLTASGAFNYVGNKFSTVSTSAISKQADYNRLIKSGFTDKLFNKSFNLLDNIIPVKR